MPERPSRLKLLANRKNALKSTGPRTYEGRQRAARNNTRHGFYSQDLILQGGREPESQEEYNHLAVGIFDSIRPRDEIELALTARIVSSLWQWRRALRFETACLTRAGCCWCENPFSHPLQRESLPARGATGGSPASACRVAHFSRSEGWGHDDGKRQSSLGTAHPDEGDFSASPRLPLPASATSLDPSIPLPLPPWSRQPLDPRLSLLPSGKDFDLLIRYENRADRQLHQALRTLRRHRGAQASFRVPLAACPPVLESGTQPARAEDPLARESFSHPFNRECLPERRTENPQIRTQLQFPKLPSPHPTRRKCIVEPSYNSPASHAQNPPAGGTLDPLILRSLDPLIPCSLDPSVQRHVIQTPPSAVLYGAGTGMTASADLRLGDAGTRRHGEGGGRTPL